MPATFQSTGHRRFGRRLAAGPTIGALGIVAALVLPPVTTAGAAVRTAGRPAGRPAISGQACFANGTSFGWDETLSGAEQAGSTLRVTVTFTCTTSSGNEPVSGLPTTGTVTRAAVATLASPASATTGPTGAVSYLVLARAPGPVTLDVTIDDGGLCASTFGASGCTLKVALREAAAPGLPPPHPLQRVGIIPPANPPRNSPEAAYDPPQCATKGSPQSTGYNRSAACAQYFVGRINAARAAEHVPPMRLPSNWATLTVDEQLFVMADLERVGRGLPPYLGLSVPLNALAQAGAVAGNDPNVPAQGYYGASSNWAGNSVSAADADYEWVYVDGWGGSRASTYNADCTSPHASGCWGHRDDVLGQYTGLECTDCVMGAGAAFPSHNGFDTSLTQLFVEPTHPGGFPMYFTWARNVLPYLKG